MVKPVTPFNFVPIEVHLVVFPLPRPMVILVPVIRFKVFLISLHPFPVGGLIFFVAEVLIIAPFVVFGLVILFTNNS